MLDVSQIKKQFPIFKNNPDLVYLDNAATTQKPKKVIDALVEFYEKYNANVHRGLYPLSEKSTEMYEEARKKVAKFINAEPEEVIFTSGTTNGINALATSLTISKLIPENPRILLSDLEHHSNILPWQRITKEKIEYLTLNNNYELNPSTSLRMTPNYENKVDVISLAHVSNVTGSILKQNEINTLKKSNPNAIVILDSAQAIGHIPVDVKSLEVDFIVFSGHKMYGPTGVGVIWGRRELLEKMEPFEVGGGMINEVKRDKATWAELPEKFEAGTPPIADAIGLGAAVDFINEVGIENIFEHEKELRLYAIKKLSELKDIKLFHPDKSSEALGVISFEIKGIHPHDVTEFLGNLNICLRGGHHCTQILHREVFNVAATSRLSLGLYNSHGDIDKLLEGLRKVVETYN